MTFAQELRRALVDLRQKAHGDIYLPPADTIQAALDGNERARKLVADTLHDVLPGLLDRYQLTAATIAADLYDLERDTVGAKGRFSAFVPEPSDAKPASLVGWALEKAHSPGAFETLVVGGVDRRLWTAARQVYTSNAIADPAASGWQRQTDGNACGFCQMLAGRGAVYSEAGADFASHDLCGCTAVVAWKGEPIPVKPYTPSSRNITDADKARAKAWIAANL